MNHFSRQKLVFVTCIMALLTVISLSLSALPVTAQCVPRTDWATHTVQRGETLYRIAQRYRTTTAALVQANCLANANRIFTGQRLRVPPGGSPTPIGETPVTVAASYQEFESGFMIWRADNGTIYVFGFNGQYQRYTVAEYGLLPDRPFTEPQPIGRFVPILGFGKVWKNTAARPLVGWATGPETGYTLRLQTVSSNGRSGFLFNTPTRGGILYADANLWTSDSFPLPTLSYPLPNPTLPPPPPNPTVITGAPYTQGAYQGFENGYMIWRNDTGTVYVLYRSVGATSGTWQSFPVSQYQGWADPQETPPNPALVRPINAFGKVWGSGLGVRGSLGWAVQNEISYKLCHLSADGGITHFIYTPAGTLELNVQNATWAVAGYQGVRSFEATLVEACGTS